MMPTLTAFLPKGDQSLRSLVIWAARPPLGAFVVGPLGASALVEGALCCGVSCLLRYSVWICWVTRWKAVGLLSETRLLPSMLRHSPMAALSLLTSLARVAWL